MKFFKRIIPVFLSVVIIFLSAVTPIAQAAWWNDAAYTYTQLSCAQFFVGGGCAAIGAKIGTGIGTVVLPGFGTVSGEVIGAAAGSFVGYAINDIMNFLAADPSYVPESDYVSSLEADYSTAVFNDDDGLVFSPYHYYSYCSIGSYALWCDDAKALGYKDSISTISADFFCTDSFCSGQLLLDEGSTVSANSFVFTWAWNAPAEGQFVVINCPLSNDSPYFDGNKHDCTPYSSTFRFPLVIRRGSASLVSAAANSPRIVFYPRSGVSAPDTSTRVAPLTQSINNYNNTDNSSKYFIVPLSYLDSLADLNLGLDPSFCYSPGVFDEETKVFTEPVTGAQYLTTGWTYDYSSRMYDLTLAEGTMVIDGKDIDRIQLTYGDDELTIAYISKGFSVKTDKFAYVIAEQQVPCADGSHVFIPSITQEATCIAPGQRQYTCSKCGYSYTEEIPLSEHTYITEVIKEASCIDPGERKNICSVCGNELVEEIPALGHDWLSTEVTPTTYELPPGISCPDCAGADITAELSRGSGTYSVTCNACGKEWVEQAVITYGQTTYTCSRCGETYVESEDEHSGLFEAIGDFIADGIIWITDKLQQLIESISGINDIFSEFVGNIKEKAGDYPAFLGSVIAILPEDLTTVFWFGIVSAVVLTVWKKWFR